jgi:hypothetical protein
MIRRRVLPGPRCSDRRAYAPPGGNDQGRWASPPPPRHRSWQSDGDLGGRQPWHVFSLGAGPRRGCSSDSGVQLRPGWHGLERRGAGLPRRQADLDSAPRPAHRRRRDGASTHQVATSAKEFRATPATCTQARATTSLGSKPLAVITADDQPPEWRLMQNELAALSSNSNHRIAPGTTHASLLFSQRDAALSSAAIAQVIMSVRAGQPLNN